MIVGLDGKTYEEKCDELNLDRLVVRRQMADLIQVYKYMNEKDQTVTNSLFERVKVGGIQTRQSSDPLNLKSAKSRLDVRKHSFPVRVVQNWNSLHHDIKSRPTVQKFKQSLKTLYRRPVEGAVAEQHENH